MNELIKIDSGACTLTETAATLQADLGYEQWCEVGKAFRGAARALQWWIGDWLNYGVKAYGDKRALAIDHADQFGLVPEAVRQAMWVSEKVVTRVTSLSWTHHREVAALPGGEQKRWLKEAEENKWSVSELRQAIRADSADDSSTERATGGETFNPLRFSLDFQRWAKAQDVSTWDKERREAVKKDLEPVVELWRRL